MEALALLVRDLSQFPRAGLIMLLALGLGAVAIRRGARVGWVPVGMVAAILLAWWLLYLLGGPNLGAAPSTWLVLVLSLAAVVSGAWALRSGGAAQRS